MDIAIVTYIFFAFVSVCTAAGLHTEGWGKIATGTVALQKSSVLGSMTRRSALEALAAGTNSFLLDFGAWTTSEFSTTEIVSVPFGAAGICLAMNVGEAEAPELTVDEVLSLLRGDQAAATLTVRSTTVSSATLTIVLASHTPVLTALRTSAEASGQANAALLVGFETAVRANPRVTWAANTAAALNATASANLRLTLSSVVEARSQNLPCSAIRMPHPKYVKQRLFVGVPPLVGSQGTALKVTDVKGSVTVTQSGSTEPAYPFVMTCALMVSRPYAATVDQGEWGHVLIGLLGLSERLPQWSMGLLPGFELNGIVTQALSSTTSDISVVETQGSSAVQQLISTWSLKYLQVSDPPVFVAYAGGGSGGGLTSVKTNTRLLGASDATITEAEYAIYPGVQLVPATGFAVSLVFNVPGATALSLPRCTAVGIFIGAVKYWDDPAIVQSNPTLLLPHVLINVFVRSTKSGTTSIFTDGLARMDRVCQNGGSPRLNMTNTWTTNTFPGFTNVREVSSTSDVISSVLSTAYSIGYGSAGSVRVAGGYEAKLVDEATQATVEPTTTGVQNAMENAMLDPNRLTLSFTPSPSSYPFAGVTYFVYRRSREGNATAMRHVVEFMHWAYESATAVSTQRNLDFVDVPTRMADAVLARVKLTTVDGVHLLPQPEEKTSGLSTTVVALICVAAVVVLALLGTAAFVASRKGKDNRCAPLGKEVAILFTDIESSTTLWARCPMAMGPALDEHNRIIRKVVSRHRAYEVKVIGDAFMIAVGSVEAAAKLSADIQRDMFAATWSAELNATYQEIVPKDTTRDEPLTYVHPSKEDPLTSSIETRTGGGTVVNTWNGLRVRIGIAFGEATHVKDPVSGGYDYFGSAVNLASRVESAAHGGQILVEKRAFDSIGDGNSLKAAGMATVAVGTHFLKGFDDPFELLQLVPQELNDRTFPPPRTTVTDMGDDPPSETASFDESNSVHSSDPTVTTLQPGVLTQNFVEMLVGPLPEKQKTAMIKNLCKAWRVPYSTKTFAPLVGRVTSTANAAAPTQKLQKKTSLRRLSDMSGTASVVSGSQVGEERRSRVPSMHQGDRYVDTASSTGNSTIPQEAVPANSTIILPAALTQSESISNPSNAAAMEEDHLPARMPPAREQENTLVGRLIISIHPDHTDHIR